jgi:undecaprenyl diphosphate synthase
MEEKKIPNHVAIILDGNGRWAKSKGMPREYGHTIGAKNVETIIEAADDLGIRYVTYYAFSTENWKRPEKEVQKLMNLLRDYLKTAIKKANKNNIRMKIIGDRTGLAEDLQTQIERVEEATAGNTGITMTIAINYGSRDEIVRAVNRIQKEMKEGKIPETEITEKMIASYLDTADLPDPDLMIRTSGEQRLSNYLLWQLAYSEFYFTDVPWPAFSKKDLEEAVSAYANRDRRYGKIKEE